MPTKTDRILSYLPGTFRALPKPTALHALVDAFGSDLLKAENSLAALMLAHWVDHADRGAEWIQDLGCLAALYGLQPRGAEIDTPCPDQKPCCPQLSSDESVEEFRVHLKRYVRTFLEGTTTVQGILRITAEALGLPIASEYSQMDVWWRRPGNVLISKEPRGDDAAKLLLGMEAITVNGQEARAATIVGTADLSKGFDLSDMPVLRLQVDDATSVEIDLSKAKTLEEAIVAINTVCPAIAKHDGRYLTLTSRMVGPSSRLEVLDVKGDASTLLLGLPGHIYYGTEATHAKVIGQVDLSGGVDLSQSRYLRLLVDDHYLAEIDCGGPNPATRTLEEIKEAINTALGITVASSHEDKYLVLTSPTSGKGSGIIFQAAAAQDARERLFGPGASVYEGQTSQAAQATGNKDLSEGVDLSTRFMVQARFDEGTLFTVNCQGEDPAHTGFGEILSAFTKALDQVRVSPQEGRFLRLTSTTTGPNSKIAFESTGDDHDATELLFGIGSRMFQGGAATAARVMGAVDLSSGIDLVALHTLKIQVDQQDWIEVDARSHAGGQLRNVQLNQLCAALNNALSSTVASDDGKHLILTSPTTGANSHIAIAPLEKTRQRRFVSRAFFTDEAAQAIFGFMQREAQGSAATAARVTGTEDLSRGVDLREQRFLRISLDGGPPREVNFAKPDNPLIPRLRAALPNEIVNAINEECGANFASTDGRRLTLISPTTGVNSSIAFEPPRNTDVLGTLGLAGGTHRGREATGVRFIGTVDVSAGVDLSANARIKLKVDAGEFIEITLSGDAPAQISRADIINKINQGLSVVVADHDGKHLTLTSPTSGETSVIEFAVPSGTDATPTIFGIPAPRKYQGTAAAAARIGSMHDLGDTLNLEVARFMRLSVNGGEPVDIDCAAGLSDTDPQKVTLHQIKTAINKALNAPIATVEGRRLLLTTSTTGIAAQLNLMTYTAGDARAKLFGNAVGNQVKGNAAMPAVITGEVDLLRPVNLSAGGRLKLAVDGGRAVEIDVTGAAPRVTFLDEIIAKINAVFPNLASATEDDRLRLTAPVPGEYSRLELLPVRALELIEYPPVRREEQQSLRYGDRWVINNDGVADSELEEIEFFAPQGVVGPALVNLATGQRLRLKKIVRPGERARIWRDSDTGLHAEMITADGQITPIDKAQIIVDRLTAQNSSSAQALLPILPQGRSEWVYLDCHADRFNRGALFNRDKDDQIPDAFFAGCDLCLGWGIFDASRFTVKDALEKALFAPAGTLPDAPVEVHLRWPCYQPGAFTVNLPSDLPAKFGGRFNEARFASRADQIEKFAGIVTEPQTDDKHFTKLDSKLVTCEVVSRVPIGFTAVALPFSRPRVQTLRGGVDSSETQYELRLVSASTTAEIIGEGRNLMIVALVDTRLHIRIFDASGKRVVDKAEEDLVSGTVLTALKKRLTPLPDDSSLSKEDKQKIIEDALFLAGLTRQARLYLKEADVPDFIELKAVRPGAWGNAIAVTARKAGPASFDITISYQGARFENARQIARLGRIYKPGQDALPVLLEELLKPTPVGILQAKAAGIQANITRDRAESDELPNKS